MGEVRTKKSTKQDHIMRQLCITATASGMSYIQYIKVQTNFPLICSHKTSFVLIPKNEHDAINWIMSCVRGSAMIKY